VLNGFRDVTDALVQSSSLLKDESVGIKDQIGEALVQLQFQDRVNQILTQVKANIEHFPAFLAQHGERSRHDGELQPLDATPLLVELKKNYVMSDQHEVHAGVSPKKLAAKSDSTEITFF
jgi:methyl-accepting chemotaxis protein